MTMLVRPSVAEQQREFAEKLKNFPSLIASLLTDAYGFSPRLFVGPVAL